MIENKENFGYAGGCNIGSEKARGRYLIFLNNDTIQNPDWIHHLVDCMDSNTLIGAAQPKILNYYKKNIFDYAGGSGGYMDLLCFPFARGRLFLDQEVDNGQYDNTQKCFWASELQLLLGKSCLLKLESSKKYFLPTWKKLISAGVFKLWDMRFG